jgi:hypothetical protein
MYEARQQCIKPLNNKAQNIILYTLHLKHLCTYVHVHMYYIHLYVCTYNRFFCSISTKPWPQSYVRNSLFVFKMRKIYISRMIKNGHQNLETGPCTRIADFYKYMSCWLSRLLYTCSLMKRAGFPICMYVCMYVGMYVLPTWKLFLAPESFNPHPLNVGEGGFWKSKKVNT